MQTDDSDKSLGDGGTFAGEPKRERAEVSLGDEATFAGAARRRSADASLGDERTLGGDAAAGLDTVIDDIEVVDLEARYKPEGTLGRGGMGEVLLALDSRLGRKVAIKRILGEAARSKTAVSRFLTEAKAIAAISHPNVVQIYDYGRAKDGPFLIMEYVDGSSLLDRCRDGALPLEEAVDLACQLCDGLAKAHDLGIVHRDIKPANVLLTKDGLPKLTDFGLAKADAADHQMTMTGAVLGTPDFMPPEQRRDAALVDARSDLWSLAATLYQMVTGRSPKIIRFDLLPAVLTQVLGKALEEAKEDRFQTARELRDALKASLVAAAPAFAELGEGQCPACGVKNDSSRRFCRGCGESLEAPCLSCAKPMPMWEEICGQCGTKQAPLLETRRGEMAARQAEAEGLLKDYDFEHAEQITVTLRDEPDPRLKQLTPWATAFLPKIAAARDAQYAQAGLRLSEAFKHEASFDYPSAIHALEQVPQILRSHSLGGQAETVGAVLRRVSAKQAEVERLEALIQARIAAKELGDLLPEVQKLQGLRPDRTDVDKLCKQLEERRQKLVAQRDESLKLAQSHLDAKDYESVIAVLRKVDRSVETPEVGRLRDVATESNKNLQELIREISQAVSQKQLNGLMPKVQTALSLRPRHPELLKLLDGLQAREAKVTAGVQDVVSQADEAFKACRFDKAVALLQRIPDDRRSDAQSDLLDLCEFLAMTRAGVISGFEGLPKASDLAKADGVDLSGLATRGRSYLGQIATHGLADPAIEQWCVTCEAAAERREADEEAEWRARANVRRLLVGVGAVVATLFLVAASSAIRTCWQSATVQAALTRKDWPAALTLDPENAAALVGLAKSKLSTKPPDIDSAFADLERAEQINRATPDLQSAWAEAYATRAIYHAANRRLSEADTDLAKAIEIDRDDALLLPARLALAAAWQAQAVEDAQADRLDDAVKSLAQAKRHANDELLLKPAMDVLANAWTVRAEKAASTDDIAAMVVACDAAEQAGAEKQRLAGLWLEKAKRCAESLDGEGVSLACTAGARLGVLRPEFANCWLMYGAAVAERAEVAKPSQAQVAAVQTAKNAANAALAAGASESDVAPLVARCNVLAAMSAQLNGDTKAAVSGLVAAAIRDPVLVQKTIAQPANAVLKDALLAEYRSKFDAAVRVNDWETAIRIGSEAITLYESAAAWVGKEIASLSPDNLGSLSRNAVSSLPARTLALFPRDSLLGLPTITNSIGMEFKLLPPGTFTMGQADGGGERPRKVELTNLFGLGVCEVTNAQWKQMMGDIPSHWKDDDRPVEQVSWQSAVEFCRKLSAVPEERQAGRMYRLPTEAEWEYACRAGSETRYSSGEDESQLGEYAWYDRNSGHQSQPVRQKKPNAWMLYDMMGNVGEWCNDIYGRLGTDAEADPQGQSRGSRRVIRGGNWGGLAGYCQSAKRGAADPLRSSDFLGFRVAFTLTGLKSLESSVDNLPSDTLPPDQSRIDKAALIEAKENVVFLVDLIAHNVTVNYGLGTSGKDGYGHQPISIRGKPSEKAMRMHPYASGRATASFNVPKGFTNFQALAAIDDGAAGKQRTSLVFRVYGDGRELWSSKPLWAGDAGQKCLVSVEGVREMTMVVECPGPDNHAWAVWSEPHFVPRGVSDTNRSTPRQ